MGESGNEGIPVFFSDSLCSTERFPNRRTKIYVLSPSCCAQMSVEYPEQCDQREMIHKTEKAQAREKESTTATNVFRRRCLHLWHR